MRDECLRGDLVGTLALVEQISMSSCAQLKNHIFGIINSYVFWDNCPNWNLVCPTVS